MHGCFYIGKKYSTHYINNSNNIILHTNNLNTVALLATYTEKPDKHILRKSEA